MKIEKVAGDGQPIPTPLCSDPTQAWADLIDNTSTGGFMQSFAWARFKAQLGQSSVSLGIFENKKIIGGATVYFVRESASTFAVLPEGPMLPWYEPVLAAHCLNLIMDYCRTLHEVEAVKIIGLRVEPRLPPPLPDVLLEFGRAPIDLIPRETAVIDLTAGPERILAGMKSKGRYNIRLAERKGVTVRPGDTGELIDVFYPLLCATGQRDGFAVEPLSFFVEMASTLMNEQSALLLLAEHDAEVLGGLVLLICGGRATYLYGGTSNTKRNFMTGYALQWEAIKIAHRAGCAEYDLYGFDHFCSPKNRYGLFSRFKSQFGGETRRYIGAHDYYFIDELADTIIRAFGEIT